MAEMPPLRFLCLVCDDTVDVPLTVALGKQHGLTVEATVGINDESIRQHAAEHAAQVRQAFEQYGWTAEQVAEIPDWLLTYLLANRPDTA